MSDSIPAAAPEGEVLLTSDQIQARVRDLSQAICRDFEPHEQIHFVCVLKGGFMFLSDLVRVMTTQVTIDFIAVSSYATGTQSSGEVRVLKDVDHSLEGRNVIIVEDIVDTGLTLRYLQNLFRARSPRTLRSVCLLSKPSRRVVDVTVDYIGFSIDDRFVVGYGLDLAEQYRNLPYVTVIDQQRG